MKRVEAPWITDAANLVQLNPDCVYYRSHAGRPGKGKEYIALVSGRCREITWAEVRENGWDGMRKFLADLGESAFALAGYIAYEAGFAFESHWNHLPIPAEGYAARFHEIECWYEQDYANESAAYFICEGADKSALDKLRRALEKQQEPLTGVSGSQDGDQSRNAEDYAAMDSTSYEKAIRRILDDITAGRYYELNFTGSFSVKSRRNSARIFRDALQKLNPSQAFYSRFADEDIISASPELFLRRTGDIIETRPIKGSISLEKSNVSNNQAEFQSSNHSVVLKARHVDSRGCRSEERATKSPVNVPSNPVLKGRHTSFQTTSEVDDFPLDQKLAAEHVMVVDLARNDLGRICETGSIRVEGLLSSARFGQIAHLETGVFGQCRSPFHDVLRATYPAASITGAPKVEVVQAIADYESHPRGLYTGSCGWLFPNGNLDLNVAIRTLHGKEAPEGWTYTIGAGGAIVSDSEPAAEYAELIMKVTPIIGLLVNSSAETLSDSR